jgi:hypothetical protein
MRGDDCPTSLAASCRGPGSAETWSVALCCAPSPVPGPRHRAGHRDVLSRVPEPVTTTRRAVALPRSRVTPLNACPALRPRGCPQPSPARVQDGGLPAPASRRLSPRSCGGLSVRTTTLPIAGLQHAACCLATPGFIPPMTGTPAGALLTGGRGVRQVGLAPLRLSPTGSQPRVSRTLANPLASGFPWREHAVVRRGREGAMPHCQHDLKVGSCQPEPRLVPLTPL